MRHQISVLLVLVLFFSSLSALSLKLKNTAHITHEEVKLLDLVASYEGNASDYQQIHDIVIARLPYENRMLNVKSTLVSQKITELYPKLKLNVSSNVVAVRWQEMTLSSEKISDTATDFLRKHFSLSSSAEIVVQNIPKIVVPNENVALVYELNRFTENSNLFRLDGKVIYQGNVQSVFNVLARISEERAVFQTSRTIKKGERITQGSLITVNITLNPNNVYLLELDPEIDFIASRHISKGTILKNTDIVSSPFVKRNETVKVIVRSATLNLSYEAVANADGWKGDRITLTNPDSKQSFQAVVIDKNTVLINLETNT